MSRIGWSLVLAAVFVTGLASAQPRLAPPTPPAKRKPAAVTYAPLQLQLFAKAVIADKRGDLDDAERYYEDVNRIAPLANVYWNLADVARRRERPSDAIRALEKYRELAEADADKRAADALIAEIKASPYRLSISGDEPGGTIFIDGVKFPTPAPAVIELEPGSYVIDWVGPQGYSHESVSGRPMEIEVVRLDSSDRDENESGGNVILAVSPDMPVSREWEHAGVTYKMNARFRLPPGHYETPVYQPNRACSMLVFDVPRDGAVFVYVRAQAPTGRQKCHPITVTQTKVRP